MSFVHQQDILDTFEGLAKHLFKTIRGIDYPGAFIRMPYEEAMNTYGCDKPDIRFEMKISELTSLVKGKGFMVFDGADYTGAICVKGCGEYTRKQLDELTEFVKRPQIGAKGLIYVKYSQDGSFKSSVDKFYTAENLLTWAEVLNAEPNDLLLVMAGEKYHTLNALSELRLEMAERLGLRDKNVFSPLWVVDFPLFEWDEEDKRYYARHHPFTSPREEDLDLFEKDPGNMRANAYDLVINGTEIGGGSIRIHDSSVQQRMFNALGFSKEEAEKQFGFLMEAFKYGAPPHGGIAFGFDRWVALFAGMDSIRDVIAFPKNNAGRDIMINTPDTVSEQQLKELCIKTVVKA
jgi:aspartyl-tRNA synthetase